MKGIDQLSVETEDSFSSLLEYAANNVVDRIHDTLGTSVTKAYNVDDIPLDSKDLELTSMGDAEAFNPLADLTGDYDGHIRNLLYGQLFNGLSLSAVARVRPLWWLP